MLQGWLLPVQLSKPWDRAYDRWKFMLRGQGVGERPQSGRSKQLASILQVFEM